jgi:hypothetical protein
MNNRPTSVTVIAWFLIASALITAVTSLLTFKDPAVQEIMALSVMPIPLQYAFLIAGLAIQLVSSIAMLKAQNWGRFLYAGWGAIGLLIGFATSPVKFTMIPGAIFYAVVVFFLFRPNATAYFKNNVLSEMESPGAPDA